MIVSKLTILPKTTFPGISKRMTRVNLKNIDTDMACDVIKEKLDIPSPEFSNSEIENENKIKTENFNKMVANNIAKQEYQKAKDLINVQLDDYRKG